MHHGRMGAGSRVVSLAVAASSLLAVAGCCNELTSRYSETSEHAIGIAANESLIAVSMAEGMQSSTGYGAQGRGLIATLTPAGEVVGLAEVPPARYVGAAGGSTSLWFGLQETSIYETSAHCEVVSNGGRALVAALAANDNGTSLPITTDEATQVCAVYDGAAYQMFWRANGYAHHRTIFEDGTLGPVHDFTFGTFEQAFTVYPASDGAGALYVLIEVVNETGGDAWIEQVDAAAGTSHPVWSAPAGSHPRYNDMFYFAGELQLRATQILSVDPATGTSQLRAIDPDVPTSSALYPGTTRLVAPTLTNEVLLMDESFAVVARGSGFRDSLYAAAGTDVVQFRTIPLDEEHEVPGQLEVVRYTPEAEGEVWHDVIAKDSKVIVQSECAQPGCGQVAPGAGSGAVLALLVLVPLRRRRR